MYRIVHKYTYKHIHDIVKIAQNICNGNINKLIRNVTNYCILNYTE